MKRAIAQIPKGLVFAVLCVTVLTASAFDCRQVFREERVTRGNVGLRNIQKIDSASWIGPSVSSSLHDRANSFVRFRCSFDAGNGPLRIDVSADARYILLLDGREISRGPHKGFPEHWYYQTYDIVGLSAGSHVMEAVVFSLGDAGPRCLLTTGRSGFILKASGLYDGGLTTGKGPWRVAEIPCMSFGPVTDPYGMAGRENIVTGTGFLDWRDLVWRSPIVLRGPIVDQEYGFHRPLWEMFPTERLDDLLMETRPGAFCAAQDCFTETNAVYDAEDVRSPWVVRMNGLLSRRGSVVIPARTDSRFLWDLKEYRCAYPILGVSGGRGAEIRWAWAESLYAKGAGNHVFDAKGDRRQFSGKRVLYSMYDTFLLDGREGATFTVPWWKCGRWIELSVRTGDAPLELTNLALVETHYPLVNRSSFACDDASIDPIRRMCLSGLRNCLHESFMDCPYFEQQTYCGDTRVEMLVHNVVSGDGRLLRHGIGLFDYARRNNGLVPMNFPSVGCQDSSTFSLLWTVMCGDYVLWHGVDDFLKARLPGMRQTLSAIAGYRNEQGLLEDLPGWSFVDWVPEWDSYGNAPEGRRGVSAVNNMLFAYALRSAATVEAAVGESRMADHWNSLAADLAGRIRKLFWVSERGLFADTLAKDCFSEHAQCLALLSDVLPFAEAERCFSALVSEEKLARATVYFSHYLFDVYFRFGRPDLFFSRLELWKSFLDLGLSTPLEAPGSRARSDCHAWGSHPLYHLQTGVAGIRPRGTGFSAVEIAPQPGGLKFITASMPTPKGIVSVDLNFDGEDVAGTLTLPPGLPGVFRWKNERQPLREGLNRIHRGSTESR